jgi:hypothetical protein
MAGYPVERIDFKFITKITAGATALSGESVSGSIWFTRGLSQFFSPGMYQHIELMVGKAAADYLKAAKAIPMRSAVRRGGRETRTTVVGVSIVDVQPQTFAVPAGYKEIRISK